MSRIIGDAFRDLKIESSEDRDLGDIVIKSESRTRLCGSQLKALFRSGF